MTSKRQHKKPTGKIGPIVVSPRLSAPFQPVAFPEAKAEIEDMILELAATMLLGKPDCPWAHRPTRNPEDHFDFTISSSPPEYLDAMEVAPLSGPYSTAPYEYNHGEMADAVWTALTQKSLGYGQTATRRIHLLLYSTHLPFRLTGGVLDIISYCLRCCDRSLASVVYAVPDDSQSADVTVLHPRPIHEFSGFSLRAARARRSLIGDFTEASSAGESVTVPLGRPPIHHK